ncbi:MAG: sodium:solute symporter [Bacteroidales bacterium]
MTPMVVMATIIGYFCLLFVISYFASRNSSSADALGGARKTPWYLAAIAMVGAAISGVTFVSVPGMVMAKGFSYLQLCLGFVVGYFIIAFVLVPLFYKRNLVSIYGYLEQRFGMKSYKSGAWFFFISKMLGASVRFFVVCVVLQGLVFGPLGIPFILNIVITILLIWLYTAQGGVKTIIYTDLLKSFCLLLSVGLSIFFVSKNMHYGFGDLVSNVTSHDTFHMFYFDDPKEGTYFWKQFLAGIFMVIATVGLDQDMMQRTLACKNYKESQKNMMVSGTMQFFVNGLFLVLGTVLILYTDFSGMEFPAKSDELFAQIATDPSMPAILGVVFIVGLIAAAYSAAGSALTSLTTSFTVDILNVDTKGDEKKLTKTRRMVHLGMSACMGAVIYVFYVLNNEDAISAVYTLASYTYGPILGMFAFGMFSKRKVMDGAMPYICIASPILCFFIQKGLFAYFGYVVSFELLILNAIITALGAAIFSKKG